MSDIICTNCGGTTTAGCWLCNPDVYAPTLSPYTDPTDWKKEAARLREEAWSWMQVAQERLSRAEAAEAKLRAVGDALTDHVADLRRTADVLAGWQDPMVGPFDATIKEIRKAADELEAKLKEARDE